MNQTEKRFDVISPDGFSIDREETYADVNEAKKAFSKWKKRFKTQGYYSSVKFGRIELKELREYCELKEINTI